MSAPTHVELESLYRQLKAKKAESQALEKRLEESASKAQKGAEWRRELEKWRSASSALRSHLTVVGPEVARHTVGQKKDRPNERQLDEVKKLAASLASSLSGFELEHADKVADIWQRLPGLLAPLEGRAADELRRRAERLHGEAQRSAELLRFAASHDGRTAEHDGEIHKLREETRRARERARKLDEVYQRRMAEYRAQAAGEQQPQAHAKDAKEAKKTQQGSAPVLRPLTVTLLGSSRLTTWNTIDPRDGVGTGSQVTSLELGIIGDPGQVGTSSSASVRLCDGLAVEVNASLSPAPKPSREQVRYRLLLQVTPQHRTLSLAQVLEARRMAPRQAAVAAGALASPLRALAGVARPALEAVVGRAFEALLSRGKTQAAPKTAAAPKKDEAKKNQTPKSPDKSKAPQKPKPLLDKDLSVALKGARAFAASTQRHQQFTSLVMREKVRERSLGKLEKTVGSLATSARGMSAGQGQQLRAELARMDATLARLKGHKSGDELLKGAEKLTQQLGSMAELAKNQKASGGATLLEFRKLIDERRAEVARVVGARPSGNFAEVIKDGKAALQRSAEQLGELTLEKLRKQNPGIDKVLSSSAREHLVKELAQGGADQLKKLAAGGLGKLGEAAAGKLRQTLGTSALGGTFQALSSAHLGGMGGAPRAAMLGLQQSSALVKALSHQLSKSKADPRTLQKLLGKMGSEPGHSALKQVAKITEEKTKKLNLKLSGKAQSTALTADALREALVAKGKSGLARELQAGGALHGLVSTAQRTLRGPLDQAASHYLQNRGAHKLYQSVSTFQGLVKDGWKPRFSFGSWFRKAASSVSSAASHAFQAVAAPARSIANAVSNTVSRGISTVSNVAHSVAQNRFVQRAVGGARSVFNQVRSTASHAFHAVSSRVSSAANRIGHAVTSAARSAGGFVKSAARSVGNAASSAAHWYVDKTSQLGSAVWSGMKKVGGTIGNIGNKAFDFVGHKLGQAVSAVKTVAGKGLDWVKKTGVVGAVGGMLKKGVSMIGTAIKYSPLGMAVRAGMAAGKWAMKNTGLGKIVDRAKDLGAKAWGGIKTAGKAVGGFLQSPAGQLLVTGLSIAATFIPGGMVVKTLIGAGIGAITAISEGKDWKGVLLAAGSGALTAAVPFLRIGPLAKMGVGALQGAAGAVMSGGNWRDALKGAAGGAMDNFAPGALKSLGKVKGISAASKLLSGGKLSKLEQAAMHSGGPGGQALGLLEKTMMKPGVQKTMAKLQQFGGKAMKTGQALSGKAAKAQEVLDKAISIGGKVQGALEQAHEYAPQLADMMGDNSLSRAVRKAGDYSGKGSDGLSKALDYRQTGSDYLSTGRDYLGRGLKMAGGGKKGGGGKTWSKGGDAGPRHGLADAHNQQTGSGSSKARPAKKLPQRAHDEPKDHKQRPPHADHGEGAHAGAEKKKKTAGAGHPKDGEPHPARAKDEGRGRSRGDATPHAAPVKQKPGTLADLPKGQYKKAGALEKAVARGKDLQEKAVKAGDKIKKLGSRVSKLGDKASGRLAQLGDVVQKGLDGAQKIQGGLEKASELARQGAAVFGEDSEVGQFLGHAADRADQIHGYVEQGVSTAETVHGYWQKDQDAIEAGQGYVHQGQDLIHQGQHAISEGQETISGHGKKSKGVHEHSPVDRAVHLETSRNKPTEEKKSKRGHPEAHSDEAHSTHSEMPPHKEKAPKGKHPLQAMDAALGHHEPKTAHGDKGLLDKGLKGVEKLRKGAGKMGGKMDGHLNTLSHVLKKGMKLGKKVDGGLQRAADLASQLGDHFGDDSPIGHMANQVGDAANAGHEKVGQALEKAREGKKGLKAGKDMLHSVLEHGQKHHEEKTEKDAKAGKRRKKKDDEVEGPHHLEPHEHAAHAGKRGHPQADAQPHEHAYGGKRRGHPEASGHQHPAPRADRHGHPEAHGRGGHPNAHKHAPAHQRARHEPSKARAGPRQPKRTAGHHPAHAKPARGKLMGGGRRGALLRHLGGAALHLGKEFVEEQLAEADQADAQDQEAEQDAADQEADDAAADQEVDDAADGAADQGAAPAEDHAQGHAAAGGAAGLVTEFVKHAVGGMPAIQRLMEAGQTQEAHELMVSLSHKSEAARGMLVNAVSMGSKVPGLGGLIGHLRQQYLDVRGHLFRFAGAIHGNAGKDQQGGSMDVTGIGAEIDALAVVVASLGNVAADSGAAEAAQKALARGAALQGKLAALAARYENTPVVGKLVAALARKLAGLMARAAAAASGKHAPAKDKELGLPPPQPQYKERKKRARKKQKPKFAPRHGKGHGPAQGRGDKAQVFVNPRQAARGEHNSPDQDLDSAAEDTWLGSGESTKFFADVFGKWLPVSAGAGQAAASDGGTAGGGADESGGEHQDSSGGEQAEAGQASDDAHAAADDAPEGELVTHDAGGGAEGEGAEGEGGDQQQDGGSPFGGMLGGVGKFLGGIGAKIGGLFKGKGGLLGKLGGLGKGAFGKIGNFAKSIFGKVGKMFGGRNKKSGLFGKLGKMFGGRNRKSGLFGGIGRFASGLMSKFTKKGGLLSGVFGKLHGFADKLGGFLKVGNKYLGKAMGLAEKGMGLVDKASGFAERVSGIAGTAEGFLNKFHLGGLARLAHGVGGIAEKVQGGAEQVHGGLEKASGVMGSSQDLLKKAGGSGAFGGAERGHYGKMVNLFKASRSGDGIDGRGAPERFRMGALSDEPRRLDFMTLNRMEGFIGGQFGHVRVHTGQGAAEITKRYDAEAVTVREHIFFAPGRFNPSTIEGQRLIAHELTHVAQMGRRNLDVRTAESEALHSEHSYGAPRMQTLNLGQPRPDFMMADGAGQGMSTGLHTAKRTRSKKEDSAPLDTPPDGEEMLDKISERVYELMMEELESSLTEK